MLNILVVMLVGMKDVVKYSPLLFILKRFLKLF